jgi:imidazolonepropionase-like amidohydrolase
VANKWSAYLAQQPQFSKAYLLFADDSKRQADSNRYFGWKGLTPEVLRAIVERAHQAHLRVSSHIESAADFHNALVAGVDEINHMPGFRMFADIDSHTASDFELSEADAELARRRGIVVVTTLVGATGLKGSNRTDQDATNRSNLHRLASYHVRIALGSDSYRQDTLAEAQYIESLQVVPPATLLKMWTETTSQTIFPGRRIGRLKPGYEASFLILSGNPLKDFSNVTRITRRVKQGLTLNEKARSREMASDQRALTPANSR